MVQYIYNIHIVTKSLTIGNLCVYACNYIYDNQIWLLKWCSNEGPFWRSASPLSFHDDMGVVPDQVCYLWCLRAISNKRDGGMQHLHQEPVSYLARVEDKLSSTGDTFSDYHQVLEGGAGKKHVIVMWWHQSTAQLTLPVVDNVLVFISNKRFLISSLENVYARLVDS